MHISAARDVVFCYVTLHLLLKILFVAMLGVLSLLILFLLCAVYLNCFMPGTDTLLLVVLRVMNLLLVRAISHFVNWSDVHCFYVPCVRLSVINNNACCLYHINQ